MVLVASSGDPPGRKSAEPFASKRPTLSYQRSPHLVLSGQETRSEGKRYWPKRDTNIKRHRHSAMECRRGLQEEDRPHRETPQRNIDVACLQETHLKENQHFTMRGYQVFRHDREGRAKGGVAILVKNTIPAHEFTVSTNNQAEMHGVSIIINEKQYKIFNIYCPPDRDLFLDLIHPQDSRCIILGDFNSHSEAWGYEEADRRGEEVEDWQVDDGLVLLNDPDDPPTFFSRRWLSSTTPDLAFATNDLSRIASRTVLSQLGGSDHKPIKISLGVHSPRSQKEL